MAASSYKHLHRSKTTPPANASSPGVQEPQGLTHGTLSGPCHSAGYACETAGQDREQVQKFWGCATQCGGDGRADRGIIIR